MRLVIYPALADERLDRVRAAAPDVEIIDAPDEATAIASIGEADAFFGKMTAAILPNATRLRWIQSPTASLEHYLFPALESHPATLTNMRGIHSKPIAEQVMGYVLSFARNLHDYVRLQERATWAPLGGEEERSSYITGPGTVTAIDRATRDVAGSSMGIIGLGEIGREVAHRAAAFEMTLRAVDARPDLDVPGVDEIVPPDRLDSVLERSDFVVVTLPHTPETVGLFDRDRFRHMRPGSYFINVGRGPSSSSTTSSRRCVPARSRARRSTCSRSSRCRAITPCGRWRMSSSRPTSRGTHRVSPDATSGCSSKT